MDTIRVIFTKRNWNPISWLIRWVLPRTRFALALSSHCMIVDGGKIIEAHILYGVRDVPIGEALHGATIVGVRDYVVPNAQAGIEWVRSQIGKDYDYKGAFGSVDPDRDWQEDDCWFCYELAAATIVKAGRDIFADRGHITETTLLSVKP